MYRALLKEKAYGEANGLSLKQLVAAVQEHFDNDIKSAPAVVRRMLAAHENLVAKGKDSEGDVVYFLKGRPTQK